MPNDLQVNGFFNNLKNNFRNIMNNVKFFSYRFNSSRIYADWKAGKISDNDFEFINSSTLDKLLIEINPNQFDEILPIVGRHVNAEKILPKFKGENPEKYKKFIREIDIGEELFRREIDDKIENKVRNNDYFYSEINAKYLTPEILQKLYQVDNRIWRYLPAEVQDKPDILDTALDNLKTENVSEIWVHSRNKTTEKLAKLIDRTGLMGIHTYLAHNPYMEKHGFNLARMNESLTVQTPEVIELMIDKLDDYSKKSTSDDVKRYYQYVLNGTKPDLVNNKVTFRVLAGKFPEKTEQEINSLLDKFNSVKSIYPELNTTINLDILDIDFISIEELARICTNIKFQNKLISICTNDKSNKALEIYMKNITGNRLEGIEKFVNYYSNTKNLDNLELSSSQEDTYNQIISEVTKVNTIKVKRDDWISFFKNNLRMVSWDFFCFGKCYV